MKNLINKTNEGAQAQVNNLSYAMQLAEIECQAEEDAIADAFYQAELAQEAEEDAIADAMFMADFACQDAIALPF